MIVFVSHSSDDEREHWLSIYSWDFYVLYGIVVQNGSVTFGVLQK